MILNGLSITIVGMTIVFAFLIILVLVMKLLYAFVKRFLPKSFEQKTESSTNRESVPEPALPKVDELAEIAVALAATKAFIHIHYGGSTK